MSLGMTPMLKFEIGKIKRKGFKISRSFHVGIGVPGNVYRQFPLPILYFAAGKHISGYSLSHNLSGEL